MNFGANINWQIHHKINFGDIRCLKAPKVRKFGLPYWHERKLQVMNEQCSEQHMHNGQFHLLNFNYFQRIQAIFIFLNKGQ